MPQKACSYSLVNAVKLIKAQTVLVEDAVKQTVINGILCETRLWAFILINKVAVHKNTRDSLHK